MSKVLFNTRAVADLARTPIDKFRTFFDLPECAPLLPPAAEHGGSRQHNPRQVFHMMIVADLIRWGVALPFAARLVSRLADELAFNPNAARASVEFRQNGASFLVLDNAPVTEAAVAAGPLRFALALDLDAYWAVINEAIGHRRVVIGGADE